MAEQRRWDEWVVLTAQKKERVQPIEKERINEGWRSRCRYENHRGNPGFLRRSLRWSSWFDVVLMMKTLCQSSYEVFTG